MSNPPPEPDSTPWAEPRGGKLLGYLALIWRNKLLMLVLGLLGLLGAIVIRLTFKPAFEARTVLEVRSLNERFLNRENLDPRAMSSAIGTESYLQTQFHILNSDSVMRRALQRVSQQQFGAPLAALLRLPDAKDSLPNQRMVEAARKLIKSKVIPQTRLIEIVASSTDPEFAAALANAMAAEFIAQDAESQREAMEETSRMLESSVAKAQAEVDESEAGVRRLLRQYGLPAGRLTEDSPDDRLLQIRSELTVAEGQRIAMQAFQEQARASDPESLPDVLNDANLRDYRTQLAKLRQELADQSTILAPRHYRLRQLRAQIDSLDAERKAYQSRVVEKIGNEFASAQRRERLLASRADALSRTAVADTQHLLEYRKLKGLYEASRQVHEAALQKAREAGIISATGATNIRVVDPAPVPFRPASPSVASSALLGLLAGLSFGAVIALSREHSSGFLRSPGEVAESLRIPPLSVGRVRTLELASGGRIAASSLYQEDLESFSALLSTIESGEGRHKCFVIASPGPGEGKTLTTALLGIAAAHAGRRVLLVGGDLVLPKLHEHFGLVNDEGLADVMAEQDLTHLARLIQPSGVQNLSVLPSGPAVGETLQLLGGPFLAGLLDALRARFDLILIDSPPLLQMADARQLAAESDGVILSLRAGHTTREAAQVARDRLAQFHLRLAGVVLNECDSASRTGPSAYTRYVARLTKWKEGGPHAA